MRRFGVGLTVLVLLASLAPVGAVSAGTGWTVVQSPNVVVRHGSLAAISCPTAHVCEAVGSSTNRAGAGVVLAEAWNGSFWTIQPTPDPAGATSSSLSGLACFTASACTAVGSYYDGSNYLTLAEAWDGAGWSIQATPNPSGATYSALSAIACATASACTAVGTSNGSTLAEEWDGTSWSMQDTGAGGSLSGVSCTAAVACIAVGSSNGSTLAEAWDGTSWSTQAIPNPSGAAFSNLTAVGCATASACTAVGSYTSSDYTTTLTLAEAWDGASWSIQATPNPAGATYSSLSGVACPKASACTAVGGYFNGASSPAFAEAWNGTSWSIQTLPNPAVAGYVILSGVSCPAATRCRAVGSYLHGYAATSLAEIWNGASWSLHFPIGPFGEVGSGLVGVSCSAATACAAVGGVNTIRGARGTAQRMLAEVWNGTKWIFERTPIPPQAVYSNLSGVACPTATLCMAVGGYYNGSRGRTLAEAWDGTSWSIVATANPRGAASSGLSAISCTAATACTAVGTYSADGFTQLTLAEAWNGTSWSIQSTPNPTGATSVRLSGVACFTASACTAVGSYYDGSNYLTLAEAWNGTTWSIQPTPNPADAGYSALTAIACPTASACTAVGSSNGSTNVALAEAWDGTSWSIQPVPTPSGGAYPSLSGISCTATTHCTAVGSYSSSDFTSTLTLAEVWNGGSWKIQRVRNPVGSTFSILTGLSCPDATQCMAVGAYVRTSERTLAERWSG